MQLFVYQNTSRSKRQYYAHTVRPQGTIITMMSAHQWTLLLYKTMFCMQKAHDSLLNCLFGVYLLIIQRNTTVCLSKHTQIKEILGYACTVITLCSRVDSHFFPCTLFDCRFYQGLRIQNLTVRMAGDVNLWLPN